MQALLNKNQLQVMLDMQNNMNSTIHPQWYAQNWNYFRASYLEAAEAVEHHGWKWWKAQKKDLPQLQMEIIDIWHFYLSRYLQVHSGNVDQALEELYRHIENISEVVLFDNKPYEIAKLSTLEKMDLLIGLNAAHRIDLGLFFALMKDCELTPADLNKQYVMKNMLNIFRQKNGYKEGTYHKTWFGQEDNVFLVEEANKLDPEHENYATQLWHNIEKKYHEALEFLKK